MQIVLLPVHGVQIVSEYSNSEVGVLAEFGIVHQLRVLQFGHSCVILSSHRLGPLIHVFVGKHLCEVNLVGVVALASEYDDV